MALLFNYFVISINIEIKKSNLKSPISKLSPGSFSSFRLPRWSVRMEHPYDKNLPIGLKVGALIASAFQAALGVYFFNAFLQIRHIFEQFHLHDILEIKTLLLILTILPLAIGRKCIEYCFFIIDCSHRLNRAIQIESKKVRNE